MATAGGRRGSGPERAYAPDLVDRDEVVLDAEESSHLVRVRRVRVGQAVVLFDGRGTTRLGALVRADARRAVVAIEGPAADREPPRRVVLAASLPEGGRADRMIFQLAELGVDTFVPLACERTPPGRMDLVVRRRTRWQKLVGEAAKSSGRSRFLRIGEPVDFTTCARARGRDLLVLDPDPTLPALSELARKGEELPWIAVGPEGGFTAAELDAAASSPRARLGVTALRTETAALAAAAVVTALP